MKANQPIPSRQKELEAAPLVKIETGTNRLKLGQKALNADAVQSFDDGAPLPRYKRQHDCVLMCWENRRAELTAFVEYAVKQLGDKGVKELKKYPHEHRTLFAKLVHGS